ncbi:MAG: hypothetical protein K5911_09320 [Eubacteriales bacterium]|nr:hypothetical protein [Eubacteriales bacterium]
MDSKDISVNREYKDRLFSFIFGSEENRAWTLELYNAVNGTQHSDPGMIRITTMKDVLYLSMKNDVSFIIRSEMALYEQQSSYNPNMPLRFLQYAALHYEKYVESVNGNKYGTRLIELPVPRFVTFCNGDMQMEDEVILRLRDSFPEGIVGDMDVRVRMININYGHSEDILSGCRALSEYSWLVDSIQREKNNSDMIADAVEKALSRMPEEFVIRPFLMQHRSEVLSMLLTEYDEEKQRRLDREDGRAEGRAEAERRIIASMKASGMTPEDIAGCTGLPYETILGVCEQTV